MTIIRVITKKIGLTALENEVTLLNYMNELTKVAIKQPGYIKSTNYWEYKTIRNPNTIGNIYTISDWNAYIYWTDWFYSKDRHNIHDKYKHIICSESFDVLYQLSKKDNIFLL